MRNPEPEADVESRVREIASGVAATTGLELVLVEMCRMGARALVRMTIDRAGGVTIDDCADFSRRVGAALDVEDPIPASYSLEVSSPGLDRRLVKEADYVRFQGHEARISLVEPLAGRRNFKGVLEGFDRGDVLLAVEGGELVRLPLSSVQKARLVPHF